MSEPSDFVINNGVLTKYNGHNGNILVPDGVTEIGNKAFYKSKRPKTVIIPEGVTAIDWYAFADCSSITSIQIPSGVNSIGECAFWGGTGLVTVEIPEGVTDMGSSVFKDCDNLKDLFLPASLTNNVYGAFPNRSGVTSHAPAKSPAAKYAKKNGYLLVEE